MFNKVYVGDVGTTLLFDIGVDADQVSSAKIKYRKPSGTQGEWTATAVSGTTQIKYVIQENDLDEFGVWHFQPYVELTSGWKGYGEIVYLKVERPLS